MRSVVRAHPALAAFTLAYLVAFLVYGVAIGSDVAVPYAALIVAMIGLACRLEVRFGLGPGVLWGLAVWGAAHMAGGIIPIGGEGDRTPYNAVLGIDLIRFDRLVHAFGFGFATLACGRVLRRWLPGEHLTAGPALFVVLAGLGVGAVNEIVEFVATLVLPDTNVGGYVNTGWDLVFDLLGACAAALWLAQAHRSPAAVPAA